MDKRPDFIRVRRASTHNLKNLDVDIPLDRITVITGISGSGKSSLAHDTIHAEGQRLFLEGFAPKLRAQLGGLDWPEVAAIENLPPTLSIGRNHARLNAHPRSTVGSLTEIDDFLRLLYARLGRTRCPQCGSDLVVHSLDQMLDRIEDLPDGERIHILAPLVRRQPGKHADIFTTIRREGFLRARVDGVLLLIDAPPELVDLMPHTIEMVVDRQVIRADMRHRLGESLQVALKWGAGTVTIAQLVDGEWVDLTFSTRSKCPDCSIDFPELDPAHFNSNSPKGACATCQGLGQFSDFVPERVIGDPTQPVGVAALGDWVIPLGEAAGPLLKQMQTFKKKRAAPLQKWSPEQRDELWLGCKGFVGIKPWLESLQTDDSVDPELLAGLRETTLCVTCAGGRLGPTAQSVRVGNHTFPQLQRLSISELADVFGRLTFDEDQQSVADSIVKPLRERLDYLLQAGVGYLSLDRPTLTLSGGELQRVRLAGCLGSGLEGACYILDEPTVGLHAVDSQKLLRIIRSLKDRHNTVIIVEHDPECMQLADHLIELGPGAGNGGGQLLAAGPPGEVLAGDTITARAMRDRLLIGSAVRTDDPEWSAQRPLRRATPPSQPAALLIEGANKHNLHNVTVAIPLGQLVAVTGVSGSGKSTLIRQVLAPTLRSLIQSTRRRNLAPTVTGCEQLQGWEQVDRVIEVDQRPIGRSPRSTPASHAGILDHLREIFAATKEAKLRGFRPARFSPNDKTGACPACKGLGAVKHNLELLGTEYIPCATCLGRRFNSATLTVKYKDLSITDVLDLTVEQALVVFDAHASLARILQTLQATGLGYLRLGQWSTTLSGGEAQRLKLAGYLAQGTIERTLFILDEPTSGLHLADVAMLLGVLRRLRDQGASIIVIEHCLDVIAQADWLIDLGPGGGPAGGHLLAEGRPTDVMTHPTSPTAAVLRERSLPHR